MNRTRLLSTLAATLLLGTAAAYAQAPSKDANPSASPSPAPAAQQTAPAEKSSPSMKAGQPNAETHKGTSGQAPSAQNTQKSGEHDRAMDKSSADRGSADKSGMDHKAAQSGGMKPSDANGASSAKPSAAQNSDHDAGQNARKSSETSTTKSSTTGQGSAAGAAKLSSEQRTKITTVFKQHKVERVDAAKLNISINVGTRVPDRVHFYPVPQEVVVVYPEWRGYDYIMVGDQVVIIDPHSHEIVAILDA